MIEHARYYWLLLAESRLTRLLVASIMCRIAARKLGEYVKEKRQREPAKEAEEPTTATVKVD